MKVLNLMLHSGGQKVERGELAGVATPPRTYSWTPIPHARLVDTVLSTVERTGYRVIGEAHGLARDGARYFGMVQLANGSNAEDYSLVLGLRNSNDKAFPAGLVIGSGVFVCDNLAFSGEIQIARKHTTHINRDLPQLVNVAIGRLGEARQRQDLRIDRYKATEITDGRAHDLIVQALDARVVPTTRIPDVLKEWREPRHVEFREGRTAWRLFNAFTESLKDSNLFNLPRATQALHGLMDTACGVN